mmetsp:Transcript_53048/g.107819  ORF Transcript_53048/g.107819 Transcript_53048/m.107819 type:complete len:111 (-) Transcript_53048:607-939(-)
MRCRKWRVARSQTIRYIRHSQLSQLYTEKSRMGTIERNKIKEVTTPPGMSDTRSDTRSDSRSDSRSDTPPKSSKPKVPQVKPASWSLKTPKEKGKQPRDPKKKRRSQKPK